MENSKAKVVGFITIIFVLLLLILLALKIVNVNKAKQKEEAQNVTYKEDKISADVNSDYIEYINLGDTYEEDGVTAREEGKDVSLNTIISYFKDNIEVANIETNTLGNYLVKYTVIGKDENKTIYKTVIVIDKKKPVITFPKDTQINLSEVSTFDLEKDVEVTDNSGNASITHDNTLEEKVGSYIITYEALDLSGNKTIKKRIIKVIN